MGAMTWRTRTARFLANHFMIVVAGVNIAIVVGATVVHRPWISTVGAYIAAGGLGRWVAQFLRRRRRQRKMVLQFARAAWVGTVLQDETPTDGEDRARPLLVCLPVPPAHLLPQFRGGVGPCTVCMACAVWFPPQTVYLVAEQEASPACPGCVIHVAHNRVGWRFAIHSSITGTLADQGKLGDADQWVTWMNNELVPTTPPDPLSPGHP